MNEEKCKSLADQILTLPVDENGFTQAFSAKTCMNDPLVAFQARQFFDKYGVVVFNDAVDVKLKDEMLHSIWKNLETKAGVELGDEPFSVDASKLMKVESAKWRSSVFGSRYNEERGFFGFEPAIGLPFSRARASAHVLHCMAICLRCRAQWIKSDRVGIMRPVLDESWRTLPSWPHLDHNPFSEPKFARVQALLNLTEASPRDSGTFSCLPGIHRLQDQLIDCYEESARHPNQSLVGVSSKALAAKMDPVFCRSGSLIAWDSRVVHANRPAAVDVVDRWRMVMYCGSMPARIAGAKDEDEREDSFCRAAMKNVGAMLCRGHEDSLTLLEKQAHGLEDWPLSAASDPLQDFEDAEPIPFDPNWRSMHTLSQFGLS